MRKLMWLVALTFCSAICFGQKQSSSHALAAFIQTKGDSLQKAKNLPGLFIGIANGGKRQFFSFGYAVPDQKIRFDSATLFEAGSITKTFTAYVLASVLDEKKIPDTISILPYLPDSVQANFSLAGITFQSLLNHTSGLPRLPDNMSLSSSSPYDTYTTKDLFAYLKSARLSNAGNYAYSNLGAGLAGVLASRLSGKSFAVLLEQYIFNSFGIRRKKPSVKSQGYVNAEKAPYWNMAALAPAGDIDCTAADMLSYLTYLSKPLKNAQRIARLEKPTKKISDKLSIGLGWHLLTQKDAPTIYWHNGGTYGFSTFAGYLKNTGQAIVVVINRFNENAVSDGLGISIMNKMLE